jgi:translation initiation factor 2 gamma subunit (eIF-2gamma)
MFVWLLGLGVFGALALGAAASSQVSQGGQDTLALLLTEVRGLRMAMEQLASAGPRVQLAVGRLQLQEQRVNSLLRRADELRQAIGAAEDETTEVRGRVRRFQEALSRKVAPDERTELEGMIEGEKVNLARATTALQRLQAEEASVASQAATEQARWVEINQRLEELDRLLGRR